jgi:hypothetical protein
MEQSIGLDLKSKIELAKCKEINITQINYLLDLMFQEMNALEKLNLGIAEHCITYYNIISAYRYVITPLLANPNFPIEQLPKIFELYSVEVMQNLSSIHSKNYDPNFENVLENVCFNIPSTNLNFLSIYEFPDISEFKILFYLTLVTEFDNFIYTKLINDLLKKNESFDYLKVKKDIYQIIIYILIYNLSSQNKSAKDYCIILQLILS